MPTYFTDGPGPSSWNDILWGVATLAVAIGGSMLWMRWRGNSAARVRKDR